MVLRQGGLGQADVWQQLAHGAFAVAELAQDHQPPLIGERL